MNYVIAILGPTASGKTKIACELSEKFDSVIISCDSVQIFKYLDIGSAKPDAETLRKYPHYLINVFDPINNIDVKIYKTLAEEKIDEAHKEKKIPILVGGTGMYFNSLYYGLFDAPGKNIDLRSSYDRISTVELYNRLKDIDITTANLISNNDRRRIIRALEVYDMTGKKISELKQNNNKKDYNWILIGLNIDRKVLYERINKRCEEMIKDGLIEETKSIISKFGKDIYGLTSIGYRHVLKYLNNELSYDEMLYKFKQDTRHYAKRQLTWFRKNKDIVWFDPINEKEKIYSYIKERLFL